MVTRAKQPIQIRLDDEELARLDAYRATEGRFPPDRPAVVKTALLDWLDWQDAKMDLVPQDDPTRMIDMQSPPPTEDTPGPAMERREEVQPPRARKTAKPKTIPRQ